MAIAKLTKVQIDEKVLEFLKVDEEIKALQAKSKALKAELEGQYKLPADQVEVIKGVTTMIEKVPVNSGKNKYNIALLKPFLAAIRKSNIIKKIEVVDTKELDKLVKEGKLAPEVLDSCRENDYTFKSMFKRIEAVVQSKDKKAAKEAKVPEVVGNKRKVSKVG